MKAARPSGERDQLHLSRGAVAGGKNSSQKNLVVLVSHEDVDESSHGAGKQRIQRFPSGIFHQNDLDGRELQYHLVFSPWTPSTIPGCSKFHPAWPGTLPRDGTATAALVFESNFFSNTFNDLIIVIKIPREKGNTRVEKGGKVTGLCRG